MNNVEKCEVTLFGQKFVLTTNDGEKRELEQVIDYYKKNIEILSKKLPNRPQLDIAILAGLKITDKLFTIANAKNVKINLEEKDEKIHKIVNDAIKRLDISLGL